MNIKPVWVLSAIISMALPTFADEQKDNETWYQFDEKEHRKAGPAHQSSAPQLDSQEAAPPFAPPIDSAEPDTLSVPYILQPGQPDPPPATTQIQTFYEPVMQPSPLAMRFWPGVGPLYGVNGWGSNRMWGAPAFGWGAMRPINKVVQTGPSKASGNYFNPSTPDPTASGGYYAGSGNTPKAVPVYQPEPQTKDYWGKQGSPLPPEMQPQ